MTFIWTVEQGEYSDYRVVGVFSTEEHAQRVVDLLNKDGEAAEVVRRILDPGIAELNEGCSLYYVLMLKDGTTEKVIEKEFSSYEFGCALDLPRVWERTKATAYRGSGEPDVLMATVWAKNKTHAVKIVNEHRTRMIAEGEWA